MRNLKFMIVDNGIDIITQGDESDRFYVVLNGTFAVKIAHLQKVPDYSELNIPKTHKAIYGWLLTLLDNFSEVFWTKVPYAKIISQLLLRITVEENITSKMITFDVKPVKNTELRDSKLGKANSAIIRVADSGDSSARSKVSVISDYDRL